MCVYIYIYVGYLPLSMAYKPSILRSWGRNLHRASCPSRPSAEHRADPDGPHWTWPVAPVARSDEWIWRFMICLMYAHNLNNRTSTRCYYQKDARKHGQKFGTSPMCFPCEAKASVGLDLSRCLWQSLIRNVSHTAEDPKISIETPGLILNGHNSLVASS